MRNASIEAVTTAGTTRIDDLERGATADRAFRPRLFVPPIVALPLAWPLKAALTRRRARLSLRGPVPLLLLLGLAIRLLLAPWTQGWDFNSYLQEAVLTMHGQDVYVVAHAHDLLTWAYLPLCMDMFTGLGWISSLTGLPFRVLAKLPTLLADLGVAWLIFSSLRRHGRGERTALVGMSLYLFNPLVLYNGAVVGRFDSIALVFLLLAIERFHTRLFVPAYALAIAAKTFPIFILPLLLFGRERQKPLRLALACVLVPILSLPYSITSIKAMIASLSYDVRTPWLGRLSWYIWPQDAHWLSPERALTLARAGSLIYPAAILLLVVVARDKSLYLKVACALLLFVAFNRTVYEQYLLWALPFLLILALADRDRDYLALGMVALCTLTGLVENEQTWTPFDPRLHYSVLPTPFGPLNALLALAILAFVAAEAGSRIHRVRVRRRLRDVTNPRADLALFTFAPPGRVHRCGLADRVQSPQLQVQAADTHTPAGQVDMPLGQPS